MIISREAKISKKIASLFAEISADTSKFEKGARGVKKELSEQEKAFAAWSKQASMQAKSFQSVEKQKQAALAKTTREAEKAARDAARAQEQAHAHTAKLAQGTILVLAALAAASIKVYDSWQKLAGSVRDVAIASGTTATESSVLLQVLDDYQISAEDVTAASRAMKEKGLVPTLETLADLSDQFRAIEDPAKRLEFAQDNLGRSYAKYLNVLSQGRDVLLESATQVNKNLILTDAQIKEAEKARLAVDAWADTWEGLKVKSGAAIGNIILANQRGQDQINMLRDLDEISGKTNENYRFLNENQIALVGQMERGAAMTDLYNEQLSNTAEVIEDEVKPSLEELSGINKDWLNLLGDVTNDTKSYNKTLDTLNKELAEEKKALAETTKQRGWDKKAIDEHGKKIDELTGKIAEHTAEFETNTRRRILSMLEEKLAADGLTETETRALEELGRKWGIYSDEAIKAARDARMEVNKLATAITNLPTEKFIDIYIEQHGSFEGGGGVGGGGLGSGADIAIASGGQLSKRGWSLVGDAPGGVPTAYSELIDPSGHVYNARDTKKMLESGMLNYRSFSLAGDDGGGVFVDTGGGTTGGGGGTRPPPKPRPRPGPTGGGGTSAIELGGVQESVIAATEASVVSAQVAVQVAKQVQQAMDNLVSGFQNKLDELIGVQLAENPRAIAKQITFELSKFT